MTSCDRVFHQSWARVLASIFLSLLMGTVWAQSSKPLEVETKDKTNAQANASSNASTSSPTGAVLQAPERVTGKQETATCAYPLAQYDTAHWQRAAAVAKHKGLLWRLEKAGRISWLYGTIHVNRPETAMLGPRVTQAMLSSDVVAAELNLLDTQVIQELIDKARHEMPELSGPTLSEVKVALTKGCNVAAQTPEVLGRYWLLPALFSVISRTQGLFSDYAADAVLLGMAQGMNKKIHSLEAPDVHVEVLRLLQTGKPYEQKVIEVLQHLLDPSSAQLVVRLHDTWVRGDLAQLQDYPRWCRCMDTEEDKLFFKLTNDNRNVGLAREIARLHAQGNRVFAAVGMLHMTGPNALQGLLERQGFRVTYIQP